MKTPPSFGVYIHIPFCVRKCLYCDFNSYPGKEILFNTYVDVLKTELRLFASRYPQAIVSTIYFGGGTPNLLPITQLADLRCTINGEFKLDVAPEVSMEANPGSAFTDRNAFHELMTAGFNRLSLGFQSMHDTELRLLGRIHTAKEAIDSYRCARNTGFNNINIDIMYGIPEQTFASWKETLHRVLDLSPDHISLYSLTIEEGTPFFAMRHAGKLELPGDDLEADMYEEAIRTLTNNGFIHYEISNFARPGFECKHNIKYWKNEPYFGFGSGATSYIDGVRAMNTSDVEEYISHIKSGESAVTYQEKLTGIAAMGETMFLGLRMLEGVDISAFIDRYGVSPEEVFKGQIQNLLRKNLIEKDNNFIRLSSSGTLLADNIFCEFVTVEI